MPGYLHDSWAVMSGGGAGSAGIVPDLVCRLEAGAPRARSPWWIIQA